MMLYIKNFIGNSRRNACNYSPAGSQQAITVGGTAKNDRLYYLSNYGNCVTLYAPVLFITAADDNGGYR